MNTKQLICIGCPLGCQLQAEQNGTEVVSVKGNTCPRGESYARKELTNPTRIVTTSVRVKGGEHRMVSVKTQKDIPKEKILACMEEINGLTVTAPMVIGDVILQNVAGTGVDIVATKTVAASPSSCQDAGSRNF